LEYLFLRFIPLLAKNQGFADLVLVEVGVEVAIVE
jgi:hypothetical protein